MVRVDDSTCYEPAQSYADLRKHAARRGMSKHTAHLSALGAMRREYADLCEERSEGFFGYKITVYGPEDADGESEELAEDSLWGISAVRDYSVFAAILDDCGIDELLAKARKQLADKAWQADRFQSATAELGAWQDSE